MLVVHIPANVTVPGPIHVLYLASGGAAAGSTPAAAPRLLAVLEEGSSADIVEEFAAMGGGSSSGAAAPAVSYLTNAVAEFELDDRAQLKHSYVEVRGVWVGWRCGGPLQKSRAAAGSLQQPALWCAFCRQTAPVCTPALAAACGAQLSTSRCTPMSPLPHCPCFSSAAGGCRRGTHEGHTGQPGEPTVQQNAPAMHSCAPCS